MKAIILAAGRSSRLYPLTLTQPKCLLEVGGMSIIARQIKALRNVGVDDIVVVTGFQKEKIMSALGNAVRYRVYENFAATNNLHTLWHVRDEFDDNCIILFADVLFDPLLLKKLIAHPAPFCALVDTNRVLEGTMRVTLASTILTGIGSHIAPAEGHGNFIGIAKISAAGAPQFTQAIKILVASGNHFNDYYTLAFDMLAKQGTEIACHEVGDHRWVEVDTLEDLKKAQNIYAEFIVQTL